MRRRLIQVAIVFVALFGAAQLIRPPRANPPTDPSHTLEAQMGTANGLAVILDRSCGDCHSHQTVWPWYAQVAPLSWLMSYSVSQGRKAVNFSEWAAYPPERQRQLLELSCRDASQGRMPGAYTLFRPATRLSAQDVQTICAAAHQGHPRAAR